MQLMIESYILPEPDMVQDYLDIMNEIKAQKIFQEDTEYQGIATKFVHKIEINKDLKASEIMNIKEILYSEDDILSVWLKNNDKELILFNKDLEC